MEFFKRLISPTPYVDALQQAKLAAGTEAPEETLSEKLHRQTYVCLRLVMAAIAIMLPIVFFVSAGWVGMQGSISAFYHTDMRNVFVGIIFAIGMCLYVYKGHNHLENTGLTAAGLFLFGVALSPTTAPDGSLPRYFGVIHNICAVTFFGLIAVVCIFARRNGLTTLEEFRRAYRITAGLMILVLVAAGVLLFIDKVLGFGFRTSIFWIEASAVWVFAGYWCVKTWELRGLG